MSLPGVRSCAAPEQAARLAKRGCLPSLHERASIFLLLAEAITQQGLPGAAADARKVSHARLKPSDPEGVHVHWQAARLPWTAARACLEAEGPCVCTPARCPQVLQEAVREFEGTREELRVVVADSEAAVSSGDVDGALARLQRVPQSSPHYARACVAMAQIHLKHRQDAAAYIACYQHLLVCGMQGNSVGQAGQAASGVRASCSRARQHAESPGVWSDVAC